MYVKTYNAINSTPCLMSANLSHILGPANPSEVQE